MINNFIWDWNMVVLHDPSYVKYLDDIKSEEYIMRRIAEQDNEMHVNITERDCVTHNDYLRGDTTMTEEERDIANLMHNSDVNHNAPTNNGNVNLANRQATDYAATNDDEDPEEPSYVLKSEYTECPNGGIPNVPLLLPPKIVLAQGSEIWTRRGDLYVIGSNKESHYKKEVVCLTKHSMYKHENTIGIFHVDYRFDRKHNATTEIKHSLNMITYNLNTGKLFKIAYDDVPPDGVKTKVKRYKRRVTQVGFNIQNTTQGSRYINRVLLRRFNTELIKHVSQIVPDVYIPEVVPRSQRNARVNPNNPVNRDDGGLRIVINTSILDEMNEAQHERNIPFFISVQHRVGKRIDWLWDSDFLESISQFGNVNNLMQELGILMGPDDGESGLDHAKKYIRKFKGKTLYRLIPELKNKPTQKTVTKTLFAEDYKNFFHTIMTWHQFDDKGFTNPIKYLFTLSNAIKKDTLPKFAYHILVNLTKLHNTYAREQIDHLLSPIARITDNPLRGQEARAIFDSYLHVIQNLMPKEECVSWILFRDTIEMAQRLNLRVRVNKFKSKDDIRTLHDQLAEYQNRDTRHLNDFADYNFLKLESPVKEYEGFIFKQLIYPHELIKEGTVMHHCVGGYSRRCLDGDSIIFSMRKDDRSYTTIELGGDDLRIKQNYTLHDNTVRNEHILNIINEWHSEVKKMHAEDKQSYSDHALLYYDYQKKIIKLMDVVTITDNLISNGVDFDGLRECVDGLNKLMEENKSCLAKGISNFVEGTIEDNTLAEEQHADIGW